MKVQQSVPTRRRRLTTGTASVTPTPSPLTALAGSLCHDADLFMAANNPNHPQQLALRLRQIEQCTAYLLNLNMQSLQALEPCNPEAGETCSVQTGSGLQFEQQFNRAADLEDSILDNLASGEYFNTQLSFTVALRNTGWA